MSKKKKLRTSGERIHPPKPPKNPRLGDSDESPQSSKSGRLYHLEESEGKPRHASSTQQSREEPRQMASRPMGWQACGPGTRSRLLLGKPERESAALPPSQNPIGRFVPQFPNPRKTVARKAETKEENLRSGAVSLETLPEPRAQQAGSQHMEESLGITVQENREQMLAEGTLPEQSNQNPMNPMPDIGDSQPKASPEGGAGPSTSEMASQNHLLEQGTNTLHGGNLGNSGPEMDKAWVPGSGGHKGYLLSSNVERKEPDGAIPQEGGAQWGPGADLPRGPWEEEDNIPSTPASAPPSAPAWRLGPRFAAQVPPDLWQIPHGTGGGTEWSCNSLGCSSLGVAVIADLNMDHPEPEERALEVSGPEEHANTRLPASLGGKALDGGCSPLTGEISGGGGEVGWEDKPPDNIAMGPATSLTLASRNQEPTIGSGDSGHLAPDIVPGVSQKQMAGFDQKAAELGSQSHEQDLKRPSLSPQGSGLLEHTEAVDGPPQETPAQQGSPDTPAHPGAWQPDHPHSADLAIWGGSSHVDLDFLPDSEIQKALDASDFESLPEQMFPVGNGLDPCWPDPSPCANGDPVEVAKTQPSRLIMSAHRDLEAFKRLSYRKTKPSGKGPLPYLSKVAGILPKGEQSLRDL
ncbi:break repair meiotic recombinase recruitment factor 1 isoform X2 [Nycticebus coucang]|uniref:break repair meiotic recombinase recruitment factor 1 isoform X2 n=1 Tax=Nycticebus coucang TaxID=9470 RepID=UPI00234CBB95|nr:break repair meiotic recombinase recruitment factor 1 isoform X2 [Nycticebus coucang]